MQSYKWNIEKHILKSARLTLIEDLCLRRLIDHCYLTEQPLPVDQEKVALQIGFGQHKPTVIYILDNFFELTDDGYRSPEIDADLAIYRLRRKAGHESARKKATNAQHNANKPSTQLALCSEDVEEVSIDKVVKSKGIKASDMPEVSEELATAFIQHRKQVKAPLTLIAWQGIIREIKKSGWEPGEAILECMTRGWRSFKADWVKAKGSNYEANPFSTDYIEGEYGTE